MNIHISKEMMDQHPEFEFRGQPWSAGDFTWIRGLHRILGITFRFCIELECGADVGMYEFICKNGYFG